MEYECNRCHAKVDRIFRVKYCRPIYDGDMLNENEFHKYLCITCVDTLVEFLKPIA